MFNFNDPSTFWLTVTNVGLGILTLATALFILFEVLQDLVRGARRRAVGSK